MPYKDKETVKMFYSIGEVAEMFKVNPSLLRFWEKEFSTFLPLSKDSRGNRQYTAADIEKLRVLYHLIKVEGFTLEGAKQHFREKRKETVEKSALLSSLEKIKSSLIEIKNTLKV